MMVAETWIMSIVLLTAGGGSSGGLGNVSILRIFKLLRLSKMTRMVRLLRMMPELVILIKGMIAAIRSVFFTFTLLAGVIYVFAIAFVQLMKDTASGQEYFPKVPAAMNSLFLDIVLPDESAIIEAVGDDGWVFKVLILCYTMLAALTIMNLLIGVLCEVVNVVACVEKESMTIGYVKETLLRMLDETGLDADGDNMISKQEFGVLIQHPEAIKALNEIGVDCIGLSNFSDFIFKDGDDLSFGEFMEVVLQLRGSNMATVKDVIDLRKLLTEEMSVLMQRREDADRRMLNKLAPQVGGFFSATPPLGVPAGWSGELCGLPPMGTQANRPELQGVSWATAAGIRLTAAATELSAAAGELSKRNQMNQRALQSSDAATAKATQSSN
jgi:hypothetical protein